MSSPKRKRDVPVLFWVSADEMELIQQKMAQFGTKNLSAYLRKMAVDGSLYGNFHPPTRMEQVVPGSKRW